MNEEPSLKLTGTAALGAVYYDRSRASEALKPLDSSHPPAQALAYVEDAADADPNRYQPGSRCDNCTHYQPESGSTDRGGCALFPGFSVAAGGWCAGWVEKAG